jgi:hypothetical protein
LIIVTIVIFFEDVVMQRIEAKVRVKVAQDLLRQFVPKGRSLATELIQERRKEGLLE